jgi:AcrR family transcriptional regulator
MRVNLTEAAGLAHGGPVTAQQTSRPTGRANQRERTRAAIVAAARDLMSTAEEITMPAVARAARVSEATAYRYFPDLVSLLSETVDNDWPSPAEALAPVEDVQDPVRRVAFATEFLLRGVHRRQAVVRSVMAAAVGAPDRAAIRPGHRFGLIDEAIAPLAGRLSGHALAQLRRDLAVVMSAEALFILTDLCALPPDEAITSAVATASTLTAAAVRDSGWSVVDDRNRRRPDSSHPARA